MSRARSQSGQAATLVFRSDSGDLFTLNTLGQLVWRLRVAGRSAEDIARRLASRHKLDLGDARRDVFAFLATARQHGLEIA